MALVVSTRSTNIFQRFNLLGVQSYRYLSDKIKPVDIARHSPYEELTVELDIESTKQNPMKVNAYGDERSIACICDDIHFLTLKKGPPVKCKCGYWFQLVDATKFWEEKPEP